MSFLSPFARAASARLRNSVFTSTSRRAFHTVPSTKPRFARPSLLWGAAAAILSTSALIGLGPVIHLDSPDVQPPEETMLDPATSIAFPTVMRIPSKIKIPTMPLVGLGVRTVSFLGLKVYSIGFYADLDNPDLKIPLDMNPDEKAEYIVRNCACVIRIVPTRTTSYAHLRDAFMRAMQQRIALAKKKGTLSEDDAQAIGSPMRKLKSLFPNSPLTKHTPLDIYLSAPTPGHPRVLVFRDLGAIESDWVATEFVLHYFEGAGPSPPLKQTVLKRLESFEK
ncbi:Altered inheritance of mitochondria protein 18, mitochondrial [Hypsizygus marmoreus]|uniref:Altered inheritance of mitochondria protein 18, mitochondrial n=1 Tax=Hypsizygus marmoreus TaxID=39966 RepID=A0A369K9E4_HYPMA|nr:Altered inheritance of mitochondria protein 18, mitochondrial [Hypsizygus marmoreus]